MDGSTLLLFTTEEILKRLTKQARTGALHIFTAKEAANVFFQEGTIVGAAKGLVEGEEVIKQILDWKEARPVWQEGLAVPAALKPLELHFPEFLARLKVAPKLEIGGKTVSGTLPDPKPFIAPLARTGVLRSTGSLVPAQELHPSEPVAPDLEEAPPLRPTEVTPQELIAVSASVLSATKSLQPVSLGDESFEEALMRKFQLALVSVGQEFAGQRLRIIRCSNLLGRNPACDFTLNHGSVSRQHCLLQITERGLHVKDLSTTNGTKVNGIKLTEGYINIGDKLTIGDLDFVLEKDTPDVA